MTPPVRSIQAVVIDVGEGKWELVNPEIVSEEGEQCDTEGCLSIPGVWGVVRRPKKLHICAQDRFGKPFEFDAEDFFAVACCHEIDHLSGVLFTDRAERLLTPDELREAE